MLIRFRHIHHYHLAARDGEMGPVKDIYFDDVTWKIRYFVVDTRRWLPGRKVLLSPTAVTALSESERLLKTNLSQEEVRASPSIEDELPVSRQHELALSDYFGWPQYWYANEPLGYPFSISGLDFGLEDQSMAQTLRKAASERLERADKHLRSAKEVKDYLIRFANDVLIPVHDLLIEFREFGIGFVEVDLNGEHKIFPSAFIRDLSFIDRTLDVALSLEDVAASFTPLHDVPTLEELHAIYGHYGRLPVPRRPDINTNDIHQTA